MTRISSFNEEQLSFMRRLIGDMGGPTSTAVLLEIIDCLLAETAPDWESDPKILSKELREHIEVCLAALDHSVAASL